MRAARLSMRTTLDLDDDVLASAKEIARREKKTAGHIHHRRASQWLAEHIAAGWASCAITQNGCVRIMSQPGYPNPLPTAQVAARLSEAAGTRHHLFVPSSASLFDASLFDTAQLLGHRQVADAWLLGLAVAHGLRLVSFDGGLPMRAVRGATASHVVAL